MATYEPPLESLQTFNSLNFPNDLTPSLGGGGGGGGDLNVTTNDSASTSLALPFLNTTNPASNGTYSAFVSGGSDSGTTHLGYIPSSNTLALGSSAGLGRLLVSSVGNSACIDLPKGYFYTAHGLNDKTHSSVNAINNEVINNVTPDGSTITAKMTNKLGGIVRYLCDTNQIFNISYDGVSNGFFGIRGSDYGSVGDYFAVSSTTLYSYLPSIFSKLITANISGSNSAISVPSGYISSGNASGDPSIVAANAFNVDVTTGSIRQRINAFIRSQIDNNIVFNLTYATATHGIFYVANSVGNLFSVSATMITSLIDHTFSGLAIFQKNITCQSISEKYTTISSGTNAFTLDYTGSNAVYVITVSPTSNFSIQLNNCGSDTSKSISFCIIYQSASKYYCNAITAYQGAGTTAITISGSRPQYLGGTTPTLPSAPVMLVQTFTLVRNFASNYVISNVAGYQ